MRHFSAPGGNTIGQKLNVWHMRGSAVIAVLACPFLADAQSFTTLKPRPPRKGAFAHSALPADPSSPWQKLPNQPPLLDYADCGPGSPILLTDGTVMLADNGCQDWWKLTPDNTGSYLNGTWTQLALLPAGYSPLYHSTAVLPDGRVIIEGGEYNFLVPVWTNQGAIYDPTNDTWTPVAPPSGWSTIGDAQSVVLFDGTYMQANCCSKQEALLDPTSLTWTTTGLSSTNTTRRDGTLLPNKQVLTVDAYVGQYDPAGTNSEVYVPASGKWHSTGSTNVQLWHSAAACGGRHHASFEVGPAV